MKFGKHNKIVLAYSGGLDTTVAIPWLKEQTGAEVIALGVNVGQPDDFDAAVKKALGAGASKALFIDAKAEYAEECVLPALKANVMYEGVYPLLSALSRPIIVKKMVEEAHKSGADAVAHGCTGKGNDQIRFDMQTKALDAELAVLAPARHWGFSRDDSVAYGKAHGLQVEEKKNPYSIDENVWGRAIECGLLEDPWIEPASDAFKLTVDPENAPDKPETVVVEFVKGKPVAINGKPMNLLELIEEMNKIAGAHGVGRIDHVESRVVGIKSREIYECPAAVALITAHKALEASVLTREEIAFKHVVDGKWADLAYEGKWFSPLMNALNAFIETTQQNVTGKVKLKLYKGKVSIAGRKSPFSLYDEKLATYAKGDPFDHSASEGFSKIYTMETAVISKMNKLTSLGVEEKKDETSDMAVPFP